MVNKGSLVRYKGNKAFPEGKLLSVHSRADDTVEVYAERDRRGKWKTVRIPLKDVEEVC